MRSKQLEIANLVLEEIDEQNVTNCHKICLVHFDLLK